VSTAFPKALGGFPEPVPRQPKADTASKSYEQPFMADGLNGLDGQDGDDGAPGPAGPAFTPILVDGNGDFIGVYLRGQVNPACRFP
jgi:hypothetical protein